MSAVLTLPLLLLALGAGPLEEGPLGLDLDLDGDGDGDDEACAPPQPGFLTLDTAPWTIVYVDGAYVGSTPLFRHPLPPGAHTLTLVNERAGVLAHEDVVVDEGTARKLKLLLARLETTTTLDSSGGTSVNPEDCFLPADEAAALSIDTQPWSQVFVDGKRLGSTPIFRAPVTAGEHVVRLVTADGKQAFARFVADVGETVKVSLLLAPQDPAEQDADVR